jgi:CubicO group peptidase (beta-lactamase class C family)
LVDEKWAVGDGEMPLNRAGLAIPKRCFNGDPGRLRLKFTAIRESSPDMPPLTRRTCLQRGAYALAAHSLCGLWGARLYAEAPTVALTDAEDAALSDIAAKFLEQFSAPGLSVAVALHGQFVYRKAFGFADTARHEALTPSHSFRIASVTKPVTATCLFTLIEQGKLGLNDRVFGPQGLLQYDFGRSYPDNINELTVYHLLTHTAGGWEKGKGDPMFETPALGQKELIERILSAVPLKYPPAQRFGYSNFGYCILGRVIEKLSGHSYAETVQERVLSKCGISGMRIAGNTLAQRAKGEVVYYGQNPYAMNVSRMDSHGGWLATPSEMVQFALRVDDFDNPPDILRHDTLKTMMTPSAANSNYACGWEVNRANNWWHNGSLPGLSSILVRTSTGLCWAAFTNTRTKDIDPALDRLVWDMVKAVPAWHNSQTQS